ncbi:MAG TPA: hypothetical protein VKG80_07275 [Trebonia sp.]|nr:hypothetical protein [Trebonia sp.]
MAMNRQPADDRVWRQVTASPRAALGTCSAVGPVSQDRVISTVRGSEVVSDPTNVLALEAAARRKAAGAPVHLASCTRVLRGQPFDAPGLFQHFRLFLSELLPGREVALRFTVFDFPPLRERIKDTVRPALEPLPGGVAIDEDPDRERARGYYERGAIRIDVATGAGWQEVGDGGFTSWTARLLGDAKERAFISCASTERLAALSTAL